MYPRHILPHSRFPQKTLYETFQSSVNTGAAVAVVSAGLTYTITEIAMTLYELLTNKRVERAIENTVIKEREEYNHQMEAYYKRMQEAKAEDFDEPPPKF